MWRNLFIRPQSDIDLCEVDIKAEGKWDRTWHWLTGYDNGIESQFYPYNFIWHMFLFDRFEALFYKAKYITALLRWVYEIRFLYLLYVCIFMHISIHKNITLSLYDQHAQTLFEKMHMFSMGQVNSSAPEGWMRFKKNGIFDLDLLIGIFRSSHDNALQWMPQDFTDDKSTLVQVMAWYRQATSHCLGQCWLSSLSTYGVARPQWVNSWRNDTTLFSQNMRSPCY